jgi:hypothetical protein
MQSLTVPEEYARVYDTMPTLQRRRWRRPHLKNSHEQDVGITDRRKLKAHRTSRTYVMIMRCFEEMSGMLKGVYKHGKYHHSL